ncbi:DUF2769 domain-containing protein [uncultured Cetobacterium sp.]|uniref:DUF2769 domain-containing protein n=1 Tax=uncultured Cetobacterium sp. TaxID=527638 RepID=UPI00262B1714|nr:DUF2769 domain-containing protein [uncultured Cetobacterium sp.]
MDEKKVLVVEKSLENLKKCICMHCKSYTLGCKLKEMPKNMFEIMKHHKNFEEIKHLDGLFCAFGKSECITEEKECICNKCELYKTYCLDKSYYCIK